MYSLGKKSSVPGLVGRGWPQIASVTLFTCRWRISDSSVSMALARTAARPAGSGWR